MLSALAPAKINLYLCVSGRREDGYHELDSLIVPLDFADHLDLEPCPGDRDQLICSDDSLNNPDNLVLRALMAFRQHYHAAPYFKVRLQKNIPVGAGLGGGSSDAATALSLANRFCGKPLTLDQLSAIAAGLGSDCAVFLHSKAAFVSGRGEIVTPAQHSLCAALAGREVVVFKPPFPIATVAAYQALSAGKCFSNKETAENLKSRWESLTANTAINQTILLNDFEVAVGKRYKAIQVLLARLRCQIQSPLLLSGSGSACFLLQPNDAEKCILKNELHNAFGEHFFMLKTSVIGNNHCLL
jgi:4-diphosphocytidyl-2-C-methyl-D-erythritol kinase